MDVDLLERARAGDIDAFLGVASLWAAPGLRIATSLVADPGVARAVVVEALAGAWADLPALHSESPFRPWLLGRVVDAALARDDAAAPGTGEGLAALDPPTRGAMAYRLATEASAAEVALARRTGLSRTVRLLREGARRLGSWRPAPQADLGWGVLRGAVEGSLRPRAAVHVVRTRTPLNAADAWRRLTDAATIPQRLAARDVRVRPAGPLGVGSRITARGRIAGRRASRDVSVVTWASGGVLAWTTASRILPWRSGIEFRWSVSVTAAGEGADVVHALEGIAFPPGPHERFLRAAYRRVEDHIRPSMESGLERLLGAVTGGTTTEHAPDGSVLDVATPDHSPPNH